MGLFSKAKQSHKVLPNQADKCGEPFDVHEGMLVEAYKAGHWQVGEVQQMGEGEHYITLFGKEPFYNFANFGEHPVRQLTSVGRKQAKAHYLGLIQEQQDLIDHKTEHDEIRELQTKLELSQKETK